MTNDNEMTEDNNKRILIAILIQQYQPVTVDDIIKKSNENGIELDDKDEVQDIIENLKRRDLVSVVYITKNNKKISAYGMSKPIFKKIPETAMIKDILPSFEKSKEGKKFLEELEGQSSDTKKGRELGYRDYQLVEITLQNIAPIVGGSVNKPHKLSPEVQTKFKQIETEHKDLEKAYLPRDSSGEIVFYPNHIRQYIIKLLRPMGLADSASGHIRFDNETVVEPNGLGVEQWPVIINGSGRGIKTAESLLVGSKIKLRFLFPFIGTKITSAAQLKKAFETFAPFTGFGCYNTRYGRCKLLSMNVSKF